jgi:reverse gyrase
MNDSSTPDPVAFFRNKFKELTGKTPLSWQERLFREHFVKNELPSVIDLPTGLGKTAVMAIWLIARAVGAKVPRRLVYFRRQTQKKTAELMQISVATVKRWHRIVLHNLPGELQSSREYLEFSSAV